MSSKQSATTTATTTTSANEAASGKSPASAGVKKRNLPRITSILAFPPLPSTSREGEFAENKRVTRSATKRYRGNWTSESETSSAFKTDEGESDATLVSRASSKKDSRNRKKKKGNPTPAAGKYAGLRAAKRQMEELELQDLEAQAIRELEEERRCRESDEDRRTMEADQIEADRMPSDSLFRRVEEEVKAIKKVAATSSNLKGTYVKALKAASSSILKAAENMACGPAPGRSSSSRGKMTASGRSSS